MKPKFCLKSSSYCSFTTTLIPYVVVIAAMSKSNMSEDNSDVSYTIRSDGSTVTDTITAVVSAILALVFIGLLVCIIQAVRRRRQERQGNRLNQPVVQTIAAGTFGTNLAAYRHVPVSGNISWENISSSQNLQSQHQNGPSSSAPFSETASDFPTTSASISLANLLQQRPSTSKMSTPPLIHNEESRSSQLLLSSACSVSLSIPSSTVPSSPFSNAQTSTSCSKVLLLSSSVNAPLISSSKTKETNLPFALSLPAESSSSLSYSTQSSASSVAIQ